MPTPRSHITDAIAELEAERTHLQARIAKVDAAIATMRDLFHLPTSPRRQKGRAISTNGNGHGALSTDAIQAALAGGPLSPADLAAKLGVTRGRLRYHVGPLEEQGLLVSTGTTASRRIALRGRKEVP